MEKEISRRDFIKLSAAIASSLIAPNITPERRDSSELCQTALNLARTFDDYFRQLFYTPLEINDTNLRQIVLSVYQEYQTQGFFDNVFVPPLIGTVAYSITPAGSNCTNSIYVTQDLPPMYLVGMAAHELTHLYQGALCDESLQAGNKVETTAQTVKMEIMAAQARKGGIDCLAGFIFDFREICLNTSLYLCYKENKIEDFGKLISDLRKLNQGNHKFNFDFWHDQKEYLRANPNSSRSFFEDRNVTPLTLLLNSLSSDNKIQDLTLPPTIDGQPRIGIFDDFAYVFDNLPELIFHTNQN